MAQDLFKTMLKDHEDEKMRKRFNESFTYFVIAMFNKRGSCMKEKVNGVEFYYHKLGKGAPLLLLHGHHLDGGMFDKIVARTLSLLRGYTVSRYAWSRP